MLSWYILHMCVFCVYVCFGQKECVAVYEHHIDLVSFNLKHLHKSERNFRFKSSGFTCSFAPWHLERSHLVFSGENLNTSQWNWPLGQTKHASYYCRWTRSKNVWTVVSILEFVYVWMSQCVSFLINVCMVLSVFNRVCWQLPSHVSDECTSKSAAVMQRTQVCQSVYRLWRVCLCGGFVGIVYLGLKIYIPHCVTCIWNFTAFNSMTHSRRQEGQCGHLHSLHLTPECDFLLLL